MIKRYCVAEHFFELEMPEGPTWERLTNYSPFETEKEGEVIFRIVVEDCPKGSAPVYPAEKKPVLVDSAEKGAPRLDLYDAAGDWWVEMAPLDRMAPIGWLKISRDLKTGWLQAPIGTELGRFAVDNSMMLLFAFRTAVLGTLEMHSSTVVKDGRAFMFLGKSGTGKSTHSRMWLENLEGVTLLNDDNPVIRIWDDGRAIVYGTPWSGKTPCYKNESAPIGGIVRIRQYPENRIARLGLMEAYASILSSSSGLRAVRTMADGLHESIAALVSTVPCYVLDCLPDGDAARVCHAEVNGKA